MESKNKKINVTAELYQTQNERIRIALDPSKKVFEGNRKVGTGVSFHSIWSGKKYFVVEFYSCWQTLSGDCRGTYYVAYDLIRDSSDILEICDKAGIQPPAALDNGVEL